MSENRRSQVTITLGRSGQVVKRAGTELDGSFGGSNPVTGSKRSVRDRLGDSVDSSAQFSNKRLREDTRTASAHDGIHLSKNDLRHKIKQKNKFKQSQSSQQSGMDLRNLLSRPSQSSANSIAIRERIPEPKDKRLHYMESMDARQQNFTEPRGGRPVMPVTGNSSPHRQEYGLQRLPDPGEQYVGSSREGVRRITEPEDARHSFLPSNSSSMMPHASGPRPTNTVSKVESGFDPHSPWTLDRLRRRSPDDALATSRGLSAGVRDAEPQRRLAPRTYDNAKASTYVSRDAFEISRPMTSSSYLAKVAPPAGSLKPVAPVPPRPLPSSLPQKSPYVAVTRRTVSCSDRSVISFLSFPVLQLGETPTNIMDDQLTVESFLRSLGLEKYAILFKVEEVDVYSLKRMTEFDLKELGIPMGPRKKILLALQPYLRRPA